MPELQNTDGDPLEPHTLVFGIDDSAAAAAALDAARLADGETIKPDGERSHPQGRALEAGWTWASTGNPMHKSWTNTTLGQLTLAGGQLKVHVNSAARAVRARTLVERLIEALIAQMERDGARQSPPLDPGIPAMLRRELGLG